MTLLRFDEEFYLLDKENKPKKGEKFLILYEDESYGEIEENTIDDFSQYADEDWTDECHTVLASTKQVDGIYLLKIEEIEVLILDKEGFFIEGNEEWQVEIETELFPVNHASGLTLSGHPLMDKSILENYRPKVDNGYIKILRLI